MGITMAPNRKNLSIKYDNKVNAQVTAPGTQEATDDYSVVVIKEEVGNAVL